MRTPRRVVPPTSTSVNYSPLTATQASSRSSSTQWSSYSTRVSGTRAQSRITVLTDRLKALNARTNKRALTHHVSTYFIYLASNFAFRVRHLHNAGNRPSANLPLVCLSLLSLLPAYTTQTLSHPLDVTTGGLPQFPNVPTLAVQASGSSRNAPPRSLRSGPTLTYSFRRYCVTLTTNPPGLQERQLSTRPHMLVVHPKSQYLSMSSSRF